MTRGESTREKTRLEILRFLLRSEGPQLFKDIEAHCSGARNTVKKYLEELKDDGLVEQSLHGRHPYYLSEKGQSEATENLEKEAGKKLFDDYWNSLAPEQRKKLVEAQTQQYGKAIQMMSQAFQRLTENLESGVKDLAKQWISELEHPNEYVKHRYSAEQRQKFLEILRKEVDGTYKRFYEENCQNCVHLALNDEQLIDRCRIYNCLPTGIELEEADPEIFTSGCKHLKMRTPKRKKG